jgi:hypothetical protein
VGDGACTAWDKQPIQAMALGYRQVSEVMFSVYGVDKVSIWQPGGREIALFEGA